MKHLLLTVTLWFGLISPTFGAFCGAGPNCKITCPNDNSCSAVYQKKICCTVCGESTDAYWACLDRISDAKNYNKSTEALLRTITENTTDDYSNCVSDCIAEGFASEYCKDTACGHLKD